MLSSILPSASVGVWYRRMAMQNCRLSNALDNMSQGLCMFDAGGSVALTNRRYIEMLSPKIVRPGCTLHELIQHRKDTGLFSSDVNDYCRKILELTRPPGRRMRCQAVLAALLPKAACAAASRAIGTRNGEHDT
jgi:PAS domain-containing protein